MTSSEVCLETKKGFVSSAKAGKLRPGHNSCRVPSDWKSIICSWQLRVSICVYARHCNRKLCSSNDRIIKPVQLCDMELQR